MAVTENTYTGNGSSTNYSFTFPYLETTDIKVSLNGTLTTAYTLANATTIQFNTAPANGAAIRIYRVTDDAALSAQFYPGSAIRSQDLNDNFTQNLYVTQESNRDATSAIATANAATTTANSAVTTANAATATANTASSNASAAVATANTANTNASAAVSTANTASSNATTAVNTANAATATANTAASNASTALSTANSALSTANTASTNATNAVNTANSASSAASSAVSTANTASTNASNAVTTANTASSNATTAVNTANSAITTANNAAAAVANAQIFTIVAAVANIPGSPANNAAVEVTNSTGIESFTPLAGVPGGFTGNSGLSVRITYSTSGSTWNWVQYFPNDPESRYLKTGTGTVTSTNIADGTIVNADISATAAIAPSKISGTAVVDSDARLTDTRTPTDGSVTNAKVNASAAIAGTKISPDFGSQNVTTTGSSTAASFIPTSSTVPSNGVYLSGTNQLALATNSTQRLLIDSSGTIDLFSASRVYNYGTASTFVFRTASGTQAAPSAISTSAYVGQIVFGGFSGTNYRPIARVLSLSDGAISESSSPGSLIFDTTPPGTVSPQERLRVTSDGKLGLGLSSPAARFHLRYDAPAGENYRTRSIIQTVDARLILGSYWEGGVNSYSYIQATNDAETSTIEKLLLNPSGGNVGIGTTAPVHKLDLSVSPGASATDGLRVTDGTRNSYFQITGSSYAYNGVAGNETMILAGGGPLSLLADGHPLKFCMSGGEKARIDSSGRLLVGTSSARAAGGNFASTTGNNLIVETADIATFTAIGNKSDATGPFLVLAKSRSGAVGGVTAVQNGDSLGAIKFAGANGTDLSNRGAEILCEVDGEPFTSGDTTDLPGRLVFSTTADGASSPTERVRITSSGALKASNAGTYVDGTAKYHELYGGESAVSTLVTYASNASFAHRIVDFSAARAANSSYQFLLCNSGAYASTDTEFNLRGDGNGYCDGAWTGGGADYAEYFEWSDSNPDAEDRRGISVVLDGDKIRPALAGEDPIGVISGNPSVVGDAAWNKWSGKYLRDEFGTYILEDYEVTDDDGNTVTQQRRKLNPAYDPDVEYISREERPEWDCVGLMGKLRLRKGQPTGNRWIKMRDISDSVEEWLVR
jgi:hypothetical protein